MKKLFTFLLLATFLSCVTYNYLPDNYGVVKGWGYKEIPPSQVTANGDTFYTVKLSNKSYSVGGSIVDPDSTFYYNTLMQEFGWYKKTNGNWGAEYNAERVKDGNLYFDLKRGVAVYMYPKGTFGVFKVTLDSPEE
jgi:hypothetical protein